jgi:hypothetical protein
VSSPSDDDPYGWNTDVPSTGAIGPPDALPTLPPVVAARDREVRRGRALAWVVVALVAAAFGGILKVTGGLDAVAAAPTAAPSGVRVAAVGETIDVGPLTVRIDRAVALLDFGEAGPPTPHEGKRFVAVVAHAAVTESQTFISIFKVLRTVGLPGVDGDPPVPVYLRDGQSVWGLQPGLPEDITWLFEQSLTEPVPGTVTVELSCLPLYEGVWDSIHMAPCARVEVPVVNKTAPTPTVTGGTT